MSEMLLPGERFLPGDYFGYEINRHFAAIGDVGTQYGSKEEWMRLVALDSDGILGNVPDGAWAVRPINREGERFAYGYRIETQDAIMAGASQRHTYFVEHGYIWVATSMVRAQVGKATFWVPDTQCEPQLLESYDSGRFLDWVSRAIPVSPTKGPLV